VVNSIANGTSTNVLFYISANKEYLTSI